MGNLSAAAFAGVEGINGFLTQRGGQLLQGGRLLAAKEYGAVAVADDGVAVVLVERLELALCLQDKAGGDLAAADGGHELFQLGNLPDVGALVNQTSHMHGQASAVYIVRLFAQEVEKLGIDHADEKIKRAVRIAHDEEQRRLAVTQRIQLQLVIRRQFPKLANVKGRKPRRTGNQNTFCSFARDKLSRTF